MQKMRYMSGSREIVFRKLTALEADRCYSALARFGSNPEAEEQIFLKITDDITQEELDELPAGVIPTVLFAAFKLSGVLTCEDDVADKMVRAREDVNSSFYASLYAAVIRIQPSYTVDMLKEKSLDDLFELVAVSEMITGQELINVDAKAEQEKAKKSTGGVAGVTPEELDIVKQMISAEETTAEIF